jgi:hypothetical protein
MRAQLLREQGVARACRHGLSVRTDGWGDVSQVNRENELWMPALCVDGNLRRERRLLEHWEVFGWEDGEHSQSKQ